MIIKTMKHYSDSDIINLMSPIAAAKGPNPAYPRCNNFMTSTNGGTDITAAEYNKAFRPDDQTEVQWSGTEKCCFAHKAQTWYLIVQM